MTLQSSSNTPPQKLLPVISNPEEPEVLVLDTPVKNDLQQKSKDNHSTPVLLQTPVSHADPAAAAFPSVSAVIDALHLSDINWDATSFTSSPTPQSATNHKTESELGQTTDRDVKELKRENTSSDAKETELRCAPEPCFTECSLRERLLMRNTAKEFAPLKHISSFSSKSNGQITREESEDSQKSGKESIVYKKEPLTASNKDQTKTDSSKVQLISTIQTQTKAKDVSQKPPQKYKFVKKASSSSAIPKQVCQVDPCHSNREKSVPETTKKSVCMSVCSSSEDSDAENQKFGPQRKSRIKTFSNSENRALSDVPLKPVSCPKTANMTHKPSLIPKPRSYSVNTEIKSLPASAKNKCQSVPSANMDEDLFTPTPASPAAVVVDSDDSVICNDSPLPLAERLRLKFLK